MWDLYNEPFNANRYEKSLPLIENAFLWSRQIKPDQPVSVCDGMVYKKSDEIAIRESDVQTIHIYDSPDFTYEKTAATLKLGYPVMVTEWMARTLGSEIKTILPFFAEHKINCYQWGLADGKSQTKYPWGSIKSNDEPELWFHDVIQKDGMPYKMEEYDVVRELTECLDK